jgi:fructose-1-phosphate kinase PfkB-like protein
LKALKRFADHPFISAGAHGLYLEDEDGDFLQMVPPDLKHFTMPGAGDAFTAGFCAGIEKGDTLTGAAHLGTACAAATVQDARFAGPDEAEEMMGRISIRVIG